MRSIPLIPIEGSTDGQLWHVLSVQEMRELFAELAATHDFLDGAMGAPHADSSLVGWTPDTDSDPIDLVTEVVRRLEGGLTVELRLSPVTVLYLRRYRSPGPAVMQRGGSGFDGTWPPEGSPRYSTRAKP